MTTPSALAEALAAWLPAQRWFSGSGQVVTDLVIASDVTLVSGDPELRHLLVDASVGTERARYQVLAGLRTRTPPALRPAAGAEAGGTAVIAAAGGTVVYDALADPELAGRLIGLIAGDTTVGPLRFVPEPGAVIDPAAPVRALPGEQSNTSVVFGERAILKVLRRPYEGAHPDLEIPGALARAGSALVAAPLGWIERAPRGAHEEPVILAVLSEFLAGATDGWSLAQDSLREGGARFAPQAHLLGAQTARLHQEMADAFGLRQMTPAELEDLVMAMNRDLDQALTEVPGLRPHEAGLRRAYARAGDITEPVPVQRIHGDYHLGQVLLTARGWVVLDFEGEPAVPLGRRRAFAPALRDVAGMLRSFDYAARHRLLGHAASGTERSAALDWVARCQREFLAGYALGATADGGAGEGRLALLRALTLSKAVYEAVYEVRHRPGWLSIPLGAIEEAL